ncbi:DUF1694 domain-containing protein, partial [Lactiplantibacillus plantarum]|nr:DUF1694 domain-containing protein [Lactiplantibacillus plantarum]
RYVKLANQQHIRFAIRNDLMYHHTPTSLAIALFANCAITPPTIDIDERFPVPPLKTTTDWSHDVLIDQIHSHLERNRQLFCIKHHLL